MSSTIINKLNEIKAQKDNYIRPENLKPGINVFNVVSNMPNLGDMEVIPNSINQVFDNPGYLNSLKVHKIDSTAEPNLTSANIANGKVIFGITGSFVGEGTNLEEYFNFPNNEQTEATPFRMSSDLYNSLPYNITENIVSLYGSFGDGGQTSIKLLDMDTSNVINISNMFSGNTFTSITGSGHFKFSEEVKNRENTSFVFNNCYNLVDITPLENWDVSSMKNFDKFFNAGILNNLDPISNWDVSNMINMSYFYSGGRYVNDNYHSLYDLNFMTNWNTINLQNMAYAFSGAGWLKDISGVSNLNTSNVTNMSYLFSGKGSINDFSPIANWDVSNVQSVDQMFNGLSDNQNLALAINNWVFNSILEFPNFGIGSGIFSVTGITLPNVTTIYGYGSGHNQIINFYGSNYINQSLWNVPNLTSLQGIIFPLAGFNGLYNNDYIVAAGIMIEHWLNQANIQTIKNIFGAGSGWSYINNICNLNFTSNWNLSNVKTFMLFDNALDYKYRLNIQDISAVSNWNMSSMHNIPYLFANFTVIPNLSPIANWNITNNMENVAYLFYNVNSQAFRNNITNIQFFRNWDTSNIKNFAYMFNGIAWNSYNSSAPNYYTNTNFIADWNFASAENISGLFSRMSYVNQMLYGKDFNNVKYMNSTFTSTNLGTNCNMHFENVEYLSSAFDNCNTDFAGITFGNNVKDISFAFSNIAKLTNLNMLGNVHWNNLTNMAYAFYHCNNLNDIQALQNINTAMVANFSHVLSQDNNITNINALANWDVSNGQIFDGMFHMCKNLIDISGLSNWKFSNNSNVSISMSNMFRSVNSNQINFVSISNWDTSRVTNISNMFEYCNVSTLNISNWNMDNITNIGGVFYGANGLTSLNNIPNFSNALVGFNGENIIYCQVDNVYNLFEGCWSINDASALSNWFTGNHAFVPVTDSGFGQTGFDFSMTNITNYEFLNNWNIYWGGSSGIQEFYPDSWGLSYLAPFALCINNNGGNLTDNSLKAIVNALLNVNVYGLNAGYVHDGWDTTHIPFTLGTSNINVGGMYNTHGIGLTQNQINRLNSIYPEGMNTLAAHGWSLTDGYYENRSEEPWY